MGYYLYYQKTLEHALLSSTLVLPLSTWEEKDFNRLPQHEI